VVAVFMVGTIFGATGIAAANLDGTETEIHNETVPITDNTTEINTTINGTNYYDVHVNYYRIANDSESTETLESGNSTLNSAPGNETTASWPVETNNTASYRVVTHTHNQYATASEIGNITVTAFSLDSGGDTLDGGGGGLGGYSGDGTMVRIIAAIAIVAGIRYL
jgi:flagellar hook assembly protein FlgD